MTVSRVALSVLLLAASTFIGPTGVLAEHRGNAGIESLLASDRPVEPPRCTSVGNDSTVWTNRLDGSPGDIFALQDSLTKVVVSAVTQRASGTP